MTRSRTPLLRTRRQAKMLMVVCCGILILCLVCLFVADEKGLRLLGLWGTALAAGTATMTSLALARIRTDEEWENAVKQK